MQAAILQLTVAGGYLAFGTLPPVSYGDFVTVPVEITKDAPLLYTNGTKQITYWTLTVDGVTWDGQNSSTPFQAVVDSGNGINYVPEDVAVKFNAAFDPPGKLDPITGWWIVNCDATAPANLGLEIGGTVFEIDAKDKIFRNSTGTCFSRCVIPIRSYCLQVRELTSYQPFCITKGVRYRHSDPWRHIIEECRCCVRLQQEGDEVRTTTNKFFELDSESKSKYRRCS